MSEKLSPALLYKHVIKVVLYWAIYISKIALNFLLFSVHSEYESIYKSQAAQISFLKWERNFAKPELELYIYLYTVDLSDNIIKMSVLFMFCEI